MEGEVSPPDESRSATDGLARLVRLLELEGIDFEGTTAKSVSTRDFARLGPSSVVSDLRRNGEVGVLTSRGVPSFIIVPLTSESAVSFWMHYADAKEQPSDT